MSDPKKTEPDEDFLEFLGGIDEVIEDSKDSDFADFLANSDLEKVAARPKAPPVKEGKRE